MGMIFIANGGRRTNSPDGKRYPLHTGDVNHVHGHVAAYCDNSTLLIPC